jgi:integrase
MREGELFALKWSDINWDERKIHLQRTFHKVKVEDKTRHQLGPTKILTSYRVFHVGEKTMEVLQAQKREVAIRKVLCGKQWKENNFVFPTSVGTAMNQSNMRKLFLKVLEKSNIEPIRFHDLRHVAASIMLNYGIPLLAVSAILGHAQSSTTLNMYGHQFEESEKQAALIIDGVFSNILCPQIEIEDMKIFDKQPLVTVEEF